MTLYVVNFTCKDFESDRVKTVYKAAGPPGYVSPMSAIHILVPDVQLGLCSSTWRPCEQCLCHQPEALCLQLPAASRRLAGMELGPGLSSGAHLVVDST